MQAEVIVVGAGLAGLTVASRLTRAGRDVLVLEARDRVGGRTYTRIFDGMSFDLGGQWLGPTQHRMLALCREHDIRTFPTRCDGVKVLDDGVKLRRYSGKVPRVSVLHLAEVQLAMMRLERFCKNLPRDLRDPSLAGWDNTTLDTWRARMLLTQGSRDLFDVAVRTVFGCEPSELSMLWFLFYLSTGGGFAAHIDTPGGAQQDRIIGGAQPISDAIAGVLGDRVKLSHPAREINRASDGVEVRTDGGTFRARKVVVCVPPATLLRIAFNPALPGTRDLALQRMPMGATVKFLARYERPFWRERGYSGEYVSTRGPASMFIDNTSHDGRFPALLAFVVGRYAYGWSSRPESERRAGVLDQMARAFGDEARKPVAVIEQDWAEEPWTRGCPTGNALPGVLAMHGASLRDPIGDLHWAGTETASEWVGYMEGAVESGERAAREVLAALA